MPWQSSSGNIYKLCLLDTNALSEITKRPAKEGKEFIEKFGPRAVSPCFTVYSLLELKRKPILFEAFITLFENYPIFLLKPYYYLILQKASAKGKVDSSDALLNAFVPNMSSTSYDLREFLRSLFSDLKIIEVERNWRNEEYLTLKEWQKNKKCFCPKYSESNSQDADRYIKEIGPSTLIAQKILIKNQDLEANSPIIENYPSLKVVLYSLYYRLYNPHWDPQLQEVTDVKISAAIPFVDIVITEKFQANILRKIKNKILGLSDLNILTVKDLRPNEQSLEVHK